MHPKVGTQKVVKQVFAGPGGGEDAESPSRGTDSWGSVSTPASYSRLPAVPAPILGQVLCLHSSGRRGRSGFLPESSGH